MNLASYIDHTNLATDASAEDILALCREAKEHGFAAVCVNPVWVRTAADALRESDVAVCSVVGFPTGAHLPGTKLHETKRALRAGATEIDTVINVAALKSHDYNAVRADIEPLAIKVHEKGATLKVILETALLTDEEIALGSAWAEEFGADYVKTSTGMLKGADSGATVDAVRIMRGSIKPQTGLKAAGGIRDRQTAEEMIAAGATRLGTSASIDIISV
jgi:deoxyribose-phosphate aldolase